MTYDQSASYNFVGRLTFFFLFFVNNNVVSTFFVRTPAEHNKKGKLELISIYLVIKLWFKQQKKTCLTKIK